jgi:predicted ATPase
MRLTFNLPPDSIEIVSDLLPPVRTISILSTIMTTTLKNIYIVGAQCTGKTTLVNALESHFASRAAHNRPVIVREVARTVLKTHSLAATDIRSSPQSAFEMQKLMLLAQVDAERQAMTEAGWYISDRSGVDPICYALSHAGEDAANDLLATEAWAELKPRLEGGLIVVCEAGCRWLVDDGVRLMPLDQDEWMGFHVLFSVSWTDLGCHILFFPPTSRIFRRGCSTCWPPDER